MPLLLSIRSIKGGALNRFFPGLAQRYAEKYGSSYELVSDRSDELMTYFHQRCEEHGMLHTPESCFAYMHEFPELYEQMTML